jgi:hypothetical protein
VSPETLEQEEPQTMTEETRSPQEIEQSLEGTRQRIEDRFTELSRRLHARTDAVPGWAVGAAAAVIVYLFRKPLLRMLQSAAKASAPVVVPMVIGKVMERRRDHRGADSVPLGDRTYGEAALGERGLPDPSYTP